MKLIIGYGFVAFASVKDAVRAMSLLQGVTLHGRPLRVNTAGRHIRDVTPLNSPTLGMVNSLHVRFCTTQVWKLSGLFIYIRCTTDTNLDQSFSCLRLKHSQKYICAPFLMRMAVLWTYASKASRSNPLKQVPPSTPKRAMRSYTSRTTRLACLLASRLHRKNGAMKSPR